MANLYTKGAIVAVTGAFTAERGRTPIDPTEVYVGIEAPDGTITTYHYGVDVQLTRDSVGNYRLNLNANQAGAWYYAWYSTGTGQTSANGHFNVAARRP